jgi:homeobox protein cut-like
VLLALGQRPGTDGANQVLHGELETSLRSAEQRLASADAELEKQKLLNERLENDLLQLDRHNVEQPNGGDTDPLSNDFLADLDLGRKTGVSYSPSSPEPPP